MAQDGPCGARQRRRVQLNPKPTTESALSVANGFSGFFGWRWVHSGGLGVRLFEWDDYKQLECVCVFVPGGLGPCLEALRMAGLCPAFPDSVCVILPTLQNFTLFSVRGAIPDSF